jgi:hypothetical protein
MSYGIFDTKTRQLSEREYDNIKDAELKISDDSHWLKDYSGRWKIVDLYSWEEVDVKECICKK